MIHILRLITGIVVTVVPAIIFILIMNYWDIAKYILALILAIGLLYTAGALFLEINRMGKEM